MKKFLAILLALAMVLSLAACGTSKTEAATTEVTEEKKVLKVASNIAFPPYEYYENEEPTGIDVEILKAIADKIGYDIEITDMEFSGIISAVESGKIDIGFGAITITEERAKNVHFTTSYATGIQTVILKEGSSIQSLDDLYGDDIIIGVQENTTGDIYATGDFGEEHILRFPKGADVVQAMLADKCQAIIIDDSPAKIFVSQNEGLYLLDAAYAEEAYGYELSYDNDELYEIVNTALEELLADGTVQSIIDQFITAE